jgi:Fe-S oxidoreductase
VREALELCVSCKGCRRECPTGVDMARMKIEFLAQHRRLHGWTFRDKLVGHLPRYAPWAARLAPVLHAAAGLPGAGALLEALAGIDRRRPLPRWKRSWLRDAKPSTRGEHEVVLFADTFNNWHEPANLAAAMAVLEAADHRVAIARPEGERPLCCGRTYLATGHVDEARAEARRTLAALRPFLERGTPVLGLEPSCLFTFRDEYPALLPGEADVARLAQAAMLADEYLAGELRAGRCTLPWRRSAPREILVHGHCHQKAFATFEATLELLRTMPGAAVAAIDSGCCGRGGAFGHEKEHYDVSMKMAELALLPAVRAAPQARIVAAGTSCRHQIAHGTQREAVHPFVVLAEAL